MNASPPPIQVAVVRAGRRRDAVRQALELIAPDLKGRVPAVALVKPNVVSHRYQLPSTHADVLGPVLDALHCHGARSVTVAEGASDARAGFSRFGYHHEVRGRDVRFFDLNRDETEWEPLELTGVDGTTRVARVSRTIAGSPFRVSLALAKTHVTSIATLSLKNMLSSIHPDDRVMMHGHAGGGNGYAGWRRLAVEFLKQDNLAVNALTRTMGRLKRARNAWQAARSEVSDPFLRLNAAELGYLRSVEAMNHNLVALARKTRPQLAVVDGFLGMHREGPRHGTPIRLRTVIAGTNPVAVDAVAAAVMGFAPRAIGYLHYAALAGLGPVDLEAVRILGDPVEVVRKRFVPHSNHDVQRHWHRLGIAALRAPHLPRVARTSESRVAS